MDFELNEDHVMFREMAKKLAEKEVKPVHLMRLRI